MISVVCIEDEPHLRRTLGANLRARGYDVHLAETGERGLELAGEVKPDILLVDLGLPGMSGLAVIRAMRRWSNVPIIVLSARDHEADKISALDAGADDYVSKPFGMGELLARVRASLRRSPHDDGAAPVVYCGPFVFDLLAKKVRMHGVEIRLTRIEWSIVEILVRHQGQLVTTKSLLKSVWGPQYETETNYLRVHMTHIRRKLEPNPSQPMYFHTEPAMGYRFEAPDTADPHAD